MEKSAVSVRSLLGGKPDTRRVMVDLLIALSPAVIAAIVFYGLRAAVIIATCVSASMLSEFFFNIIAKKDQTAGDLSAVVTGLLLALNLTTYATLWQCLVGSVFAIVIVKCAFGGLGKNFVNPSVTAKVMLVIAFGGVSVEQSITEYSIWDKLLGNGNAGAAIGTTSAVAVLVGAIYLLVRRVIGWQIPVIYVAGVFALSFALGGNVDAALDGILGGGLLLAAVFMATDPVTSPKKSWGKVVFALGCSILTVLISSFGTYGTSAVVFAILFMNILTPYIDMIFEKKTEEVEA